MYSGKVTLMPPSPWMPSTRNGNGLGCNGGLDGGDVVEGNVKEAGQKRIEADLDLVLPGRRKRRHGPAMKRIFRGDDFVPAGVVAEFPGHLDQGFVGFRPRCCRRKPCPGR